MNDFDETPKDETNDFVFDMPEIPTGTGEVKEVADAFQANKQPSQNIAFVSAGAVGRIVDSFWRMGYRKALLCNTTSLDMAGIACPNQWVPEDKEEAVGTAKDPKVAEVIAQKHGRDIASKMRDVFGDVLDKIYIVIGGGGGTGTGMAFELIKICEEYLRLTEQGDSKKRLGFIVTLPRRSESPIAQANAYQLMEGLLEKMGDRFSSLILIDNACIQKLFVNIAASGEWSIPNNHFCQLFHTFNVLAGRPTPQRVFDPAEYQALLESGIVVFSGMEFEDISRDAISRNMRVSLEKNFLGEGFDWTTAKKAAALAITSKDTLDNRIKIDDFEHAFAQLRKFLDVNTLNTGIYIGNRNSLQLFTMVGGLEAPQKRLEEIATLAEIVKPKDEDKISDDNDEMSGR